ncbi:hypothetical protein FDA94_16900 [Herbidospora galbida]|uniref:Uncharacterized protein n=1 Tax=Herbidospora galbida TaxID=2575442 RepID=A0A4U3MHQ6_9ACTN|nr:hypothetical protein [Herbidospora galbida]TKK87507.1 hypothetical protein FDA94_16900 [Herbidospora galbida]
MKALNARRVAWEAARVLVEASTAETYWWVSDMVGRHLGVMYQLKLAETRLRLVENDEFTVAETGTWRARLDELLGDRPDLMPLVADLTKETAARLP